MKTIFKRPVAYIGIVALVLLIAAYGFTASSGEPRGETAEVVVGDVQSEVSLTGTITAGKKAALSFDRGGKIDAFYASVGETMAAGALLATLENDAERAAVAEEETGVEIANTKLAETKRGTRPEELRVKEAALEKAGVARTNLLEKTPVIIADAYNQAETALNRLLDPLFSNGESAAPRLNFGSNNQQSVYRAEAERVTAGTSVRALQTLMSPDSATDEETRLAESLGHLRVLQSLCITLSDSLASATGIDAATRADYKERVSTARANLTSAMTAAQNHLNSLRESAAAEAEKWRELELAGAGATTEALDEAEQTVRQAEARRETARAALEQTFLRAPFAGRVASKEAEAGETVSAGERVMDFLSTDTFVIEANVPEADIAKINQDDIAIVTLDALGDETILRARVALVESAENKIEGVPTYKTTFAFEAPDARVKSGMTANLTIVSVLKRGVLIIPARAVSSENGSFVVTKVLPSGETEKVPVKTGSRGSSREIEITEGLHAGDIVTIPPAK